MFGKSFLGNEYPGTYICVDGPGACGKSKQAGLLAELLKGRYSDKEVLLTHEPGGTLRAELLEEALVSNPENKGPEFNALEQAYIFAVSRGHLIDHEIRPVLEEGGIVVADRWFLSSVAHQAVAGDLGFSRVQALNEPMINGVYPNISILLDVPEEVTKQRFRDRGERDNVYDSRPPEYYKAVRRGYLDYARRFSFSSQGCQLILDGTRSIKSLSKEIFDVTVRWIDGNAEQRRELKTEIQQGYLMRRVEGVSASKER